MRPSGAGPRPLVGARHRKDIERRAMSRPETLATGAGSKEHTPLMRQYQRAAANGLK